MYLITLVDVLKRFIIVGLVWLIGSCAAQEHPGKTTEQLLIADKTELQHPTQRLPKCRSSAVLYCDHRKAGAADQCVCASRW